jgi:hypothetical protein
MSDLITRHHCNTLRSPQLHVLANVLTSMLPWRACWVVAREAGSRVICSWASLARELVLTASTVPVIGHLRRAATNPAGTTKIPASALKFPVKRRRELAVSP